MRYDIKRLQYTLTLTTLVITSDINADLEDFGKLVAVSLRNTGTSVERNLFKLLPQCLSTIFHTVWAKSPD